MIRPSTRLLGCLLSLGMASQEVRGEVVRLQRAPICFTESSGRCTLVAKISGVINASTVDELRRLFDQTRRAAEQEKKRYDVGPIELDSPGGSVAAAITIGRFLRKEKASVIIDDGAVCYSACVLILAGAVGRAIEGKVGIHRPYLEVPAQPMSSDNVREVYQRMLQDMRSYFREMNVSEQLADAMLRISPENILLLNEPALKNYGLTLDDPIEEETRDLSSAQLYGLDRQEYMKRKAFVERQCGYGPESIECRDRIMCAGTAPSLTCEYSRNSQRTGSPQQRGNVPTAPFPIKPGPGVPVPFIPAPAVPGL
jgi:hypothetical protein